MRLIAVLGSALFFAIAPGSILGLGPWWITRWRFESPAWEALPLRVVGAVLILAGVPILLESFARFALEGLGTPAPVAPPRHLVVTGVYRHVRNPIYVALTSIIVGQALLFGNVVLFGYAAIWFFVFNLAVFVHEEPALRETFGAEYEAYCANVPRWLPRLRGYSLDSSRHSGGSPKG
jgi:protein-S-isoprenylcysteine O-methyltransferase Ste14